jgi:hypothetical protein
MRSFLRMLPITVALSPVFGACQAPAASVPAAPGANIPVMSVVEAERLPPGRIPRIFKDSNPYLAYPYNIHETDGLSRNPDDCVRWGCVDQNGR